MKGEDQARGLLLNKMWLSNYWVLKCYLMLFLHSPSWTGWIYVSETLKTVLFSISAEIPEKVSQNNSEKQRSVNFIHLITNKIDLWNHETIYLISLFCFPNEGLKGIWWIMRTYVWNRTKFLRKSSLDNHFVEHCDAFCGFKWTFWWAKIYFISLTRQ